MDSTTGKAKMHLAHIWNNRDRMKFQLRENGSGISKDISPKTQANTWYRITLKYNSEAGTMNWAVFDLTHKKPFHRRNNIPWKFTGSFDYLRLGQSENQPGSTAAIRVDNILISKQ